MNLLNFFKSKTEPGVVKSIWRNNMWVMTPLGVGVLFKLGEPNLVHLVDENGETQASEYFSSTQLRQAKWEEIPSVRRKVDREKGYQLGYF